MTDHLSSVNDIAHAPIRVITGRANGRGASSSTIIWTYVVVGYLLCDVCMPEMGLASPCFPVRFDVCIIYIYIYIYIYICG
jgi:hypothetical protein